jgi:hypothetical protein
VEAAQQNRGERWFKELLSSNEVNTTELILMLCDALWMQRNQRTFTDKSLEAEYIAISVSANLRRFQAANSWPERTSDDLSSGSLLRPPPGGTRVFFDAGIKEGRAGIAAVAVDGNGAFIRAITGSVSGVTDPSYAEGRALEAAIKLAAELGIATVIGDCLKLIQRPRDFEPPSLPCRELVAELRLLITENSIGAPCWVPRDNNVLAHSLAMFAKERLDTKVIWDSPPAFLMSNDSGRFPVA